MEAVLIECLSCRRRYGLDDIKSHQYFLPSMICHQCYGQWQQKPQDEHCFGKDRPPLGLDPASPDCQACPDRLPCMAVLGHQVQLPKWESFCTWFERHLARALATVEGVPPSVIILPSQAKDRLRLLNLHVWSLRYAVTVELLLRVLLDKYRNVRQPSDGFVTLGVRAATLCGVKSRQWVESIVSQAYPNGENYLAYRSAMITRLVGVPKVRGDILQHYSSAMERYRQRYYQCMERYYRPWRGNPWRMP